MFKFLKSGFAFNKMAETMNMMVSMLNDVIPKIESNLFPNSEFKEDIALLAYVARKGVIDRLEEHGFTMDAKITVTAISSSKISLLEAYSKTVGTVILFADKVSMASMCDNILEKRQAFYDIEKMLPEQVKKNI